MKRLSASLFLGWAGLLASCSPIPSTEVLFYFSATTDLRPRAAEFTVVVETQEGEVALEKTIPLTGTDATFARVPVVPRGGNESRVVTVTGTLKDADGASLGVKRAIARFKEEATTEVYVVFDDSCAGVADCGEGRTCENGTCVGACVEPAEAGASRETPPVCGECETCGGGKCVAVTDGSDCGCAGDACAGGECIIERRVRTLMTGEEHSCALVGAPGATSDFRDVYCWGSNEFGQLAADESLADSPDPVSVPFSADAERADLTGGSGYACVLNVTNSYVCWGTNENGQFGDGADGASTDGSVVREPQTVDEWEMDGLEGWAPNGEIKTLATGPAHGCAIDNEAGLWCWGYACHGALGRGDDAVIACQGDPRVIQDASPAPVLTDLNWESVSAGGEGHTCGITRDGALYCWGLNASGQLGLGTTTQTTAPKEAVCANAPGECDHGWTSVSAGLFYTCAIRDDATLWCWGGNQSGQVGEGPREAAVVSPQQIGAGASWSSVAAGYGQTCAIREDDESLWCWGAGASGQLGNGDREARTSPTRVHGSGAQWLKVVSGGRHVCGLQADGSAWCWGDNNVGQVGTGEITDTGVLTPHRVCFGD